MFADSVEWISDSLSLTNERERTSVLHSAHASINFQELDHFANARQTLTFVIIIDDDV